MIHNYDSLIYSFKIKLDISTPETELSLNAVASHSHVEMGEKSLKILSSRVGVLSCAMVSQILFYICPE